jgi:hypothetical protein
MIISFLLSSFLHNKFKGDIQPGFEPDLTKMIGYIKQPFLGGMFSPKLNVMDRQEGQTIATIQAEAKCCIGGMVRLSIVDFNLLLISPSQVSTNRAK